MVSLKLSIFPSRTPVQVALFYRFPVPVFPPILRSSFRSLQQVVLVNLSTLWHAVCRTALRPILAADFQAVHCSYKKSKDSIEKGAGKTLFFYAYCWTFEENWPADLFVSVSFQNTTLEMSLKCVHKKGSKPVSYCKEQLVRIVPLPSPNSVESYFNFLQSNREGNTPKPGA